MQSSTVALQRRAGYQSGTFPTCSTLFVRVTKRMSPGSMYIMAVGVRRWLDGPTPIADRQ